MTGTIRKHLYCVPGTWRPAHTLFQLPLGANSGGRYSHPTAKQRKAELANCHRFSVCGVRVTEDAVRSFI